ncbi:chitin-binding domain protein cbd-1-like [Diabrotica virgifera virgifera]|uniref:Chitin-binding domain protein cbd-1-like n=1 Tax=Diabrotica virgifera virgifera TaxID=50390 RepID=A0A6P7GIZ8_DIAVI|nr:chitin-binding domain protein cbd-1-like [Diabrotica virgifera virgifera]
MLQIFLLSALILHAHLQPTYCPMGSYFEHETDCTKFYQCAPWGAQLMNCSSGTVFDPEINVCSWRRPGICGWTTTEITTNPELSTGSCSKEPTTISTTIKPDPISICRERPEEVFINANPYDGSQFIVCNSGNGVINSCPNDKFYDPITGSCSSQKKADTCETNPDQTVYDPISICRERPNEKFVKEIPNNCSQYIMCNCGNGVIHTCPDNQFFHPKTKSCSILKNDNCSPK